MENTTAEVHSGDGLLDMLYWKGAEHWAFLQLAIIILSASKKKHYLVHIQKLHDTKNNVSTSLNTEGSPKRPKRIKDAEVKVKNLVYLFIY